MTMMAITRTLMMTVTSMSTSKTIRQNLGSFPATTSVRVLEANKAEPTRI